MAGVLLRLAASPLIILLLGLSDYWVPILASLSDGSPAPQNPFTDVYHCPHNHTDRPDPDRDYRRWGSWGRWSNCNPTCGPVMTRSRTRGCHGPLICIGPELDMELCDLAPCPGWGQWGPWDDCSLGIQKDPPQQTCIEFRKRRRECLDEEGEVSDDVTCVLDKKKKCSPCSPATTEDLHVKYQTCADGVPGKMKDVYFCPRA